jgi:hypothetical protein
LATTPLDDGWCASRCASTTPPVPEGLDRAAALRSSLLSTHLVAHARAPLRLAGRPGSTAARQSVRGPREHLPGARDDNDDTVVGAAIVLPDHPQIAPESQGGLFDSTEIEEALLLHVQVLSDGEREEIARADPAVREMVERAAAVAPRELAGLHGRVTLRDPETTSPPEAPPGLTDPSVDGIVYRERRWCCAPASATPQDGVWAGRMATIERIYRDYEDGVHIAVTVDDDRAGADARHRPLPYFKPARWRWSRRPRAQAILSPVSATWLRTTLRRRGRAPPRNDGVAARGQRDGRRHERPRPRLRDHARLQRAGHRRRQPPGRRPGHAVCDRR